LILKGDTFSWIDGADPKENVEFRMPGLEKVWFTCQSQTAGEVCYQINFQIVKGPRYSFVDVSRATGLNATVQALTETLRKTFPAHRSAHRSLRGRTTSKTAVPGWIVNPSVRERAHVCSDLSGSPLVSIAQELPPLWENDPQNAKSPLWKHLRNET
jgi:hypothetical protein